MYFAYMKALLLVLVGVVFGVLGNTVTLDHFVPKSLPRQFVILVTPAGPVFGEAKENEDLMALLRGYIGKDQEGTSVEPEKPKITF